jgi:hypothetical protein
MNPDHLFAGTPEDNVRDMMKKGRCVANKKLPLGEAHHATSLTERDVIEIRKSSATKKYLAASYGVSLSTIRNILTGRTWSHIGLPPA